MYEKLRNAVDVAGRVVKVVEKQSSNHYIRSDGSIVYTSPPRYFCPDGRALIPEGKGCYLSDWGKRYRLID